MLDIAGYTPVTRSIFTRGKLFSQIRFLRVVWIIEILFYFLHYRDTYEYELTL